MEQPVETNETENPEIVEAETEETYGEPRGAMTFVMLLGLFYLVYYFLTWFEVMVLRGS